MHESHEATLTLWPATPLPAAVAHQLRSVGVDLSTLTVKGGWLAARRTADDTVVLELSFGDCPYGLTGLEAVLAAARLAGLGYVAWGTRKSEIAGPARSYDPASGVEHEFTVMADGEPVLTSSDLDAFEHFGTAEALLCEVRRSLRLPIPETVEELTSDALSFVIEDGAPWPSRNAAAAVDA